MKRVLFLFLIVCFGSGVFGVPLVSDVVGELKDNQTLFLTGNNFRTNNLNIEWLGGQNGNIEQGVDGDVFTKAKWDADLQSTAREVPKYTSTKFHSGNKSILSAFPIESQYTSGFSFNNGATFDSIYVSYWVYFDHFDSQGQWKMWRIRPSSGYGDVNGEIMTSQWYDVDGGNYQNYLMLFCDYLNYSKCYTNGVADLYGSDEDTITPGEWIRVEIYAKGSSIDGVNDGELYYTISKYNETTHVMRDYNNITTRLSGTSKWSHFILENYWGNIGAGTGTEEKIYIDDIYIQIDNRARVEVCDNLVWADKTHCEIQYPTSWTNNSIEIDFNQGSFEDGQEVYLFVIDEEGSVSDGYEVIVGEEFEPEVGICEAPDGYNCWYVAVDGNDSNDGSFENPFASIQYAVDAMNGGDIVYLRNGTYYQTDVYIETRGEDSINGNPDAYTTIKSYPGEWAKIDGEWASTRVSRALISHYPAASLEYFIFEHLELTGGGVNAEVESTAIRLHNPKNVIFRYNYIHDNYALNCNENPAGLLMSTPSHVTIEYNYFKDNGALVSNTGNCANVAFFSDYKDLTDNDFDFSIATKNNTVRYNLLVGSGVGIKHKNQQIFGEADRDIDDMTYMNYGDKIHHNIILENGLSAITAQQDFIQVYNNIADKEFEVESDAYDIGIFVKKFGSDEDVYHSAVYNNLMMNYLGGIHISQEEDSKDIAPVSYIYNNIISNSSGDYRREDISIGSTINQANDWDPIGDIDLSRCSIENNYIYDSNEEEYPLHVAVGRSGYWPERTDRQRFLMDDFDLEFGYENYDNPYESGNLLFLGESGADRYITSGEHVIDGVVTIANGGIGGNHPYLDGVSLPSYIGAVNPDDNAWVAGVLGLEDIDYLRDVSGDEPVWVEGVYVEVPPDEYNPDLNNNNLIDFNELVQIIIKYKDGDYTFGELLNFVNKWKDGVGV